VSTLQLATYLDVLVGHADVLSVRSEIFGRRHDGELDRPLVAKRLVRPFPHGADLLDCGNTIVRDKHLKSTAKVSNNHTAIAGGGRLFSRL